MAHNTYIHGTDSAEQERLTLLNRLTNQAFIDFLSLGDARSILEIGSGLGLLAEQIATLVPQSEVWGLEYSPAQLVAAGDHRRPNLHFIQGDAHRLPFQDECFDVVYCRYVLEHVADPTLNQTSGDSYTCSIVPEPSSVRYAHGNRRAAVLFCRVHFMHHFTGAQSARYHLSYTKREEFNGNDNTRTPECETPTLRRSADP